MPCPENVVDTDDILVVETEQDLDFSQRALAVRLVLKWADFLDGDALVCHVIQSGAVRHRTVLILHTARFMHNHGHRNLCSVQGGAGCYNAHATIVLALKCGEVL